MKKLLNYDLQIFAEDEAVAGENEVEETATPEEETTEGESSETVAEESGNDEPQEQSAEDNARYAAIRRRAEEDAKRRYESEQNARNQRIAAMCQGITHPVTGKPITTEDEYLDALEIQQRQARERELQDKGVDPRIIDQMIAQNPVVQQAQQVIEQNKMSMAEQQLQNDIASISKYDPNIKGIDDLAAMPNFPEIVDRVSKGQTLLDAYKSANFDAFMQHTNEAARQQAINQMRGKQHLPSQSQSVATNEEYVEVPADIMSRWKSEGKTEKQIRELYKSVTSKLHIS